MEAKSGDGSSSTRGRIGVRGSSDERGEWCGEARGCALSFIGGERRPGGGNGIDGWGGVKEGS
jgi:hypothetical protein